MHNINRQGLIQHTELSGSNVIVDMPQDSFAVSMLEQHLQMNYPLAEMQLSPFWPPTLTTIARFKIVFPSHEDAIHFHLRHND